MAARGSPMGILMIAAGVVFLNLAYTGKGKDVWAALMGTSPSASGTTSGSGGTGTTNTTWAGGKVFTIADGDNCPSGYHKATSPDGTMCYAIGDASIAHWAKTAPCHDWISATDESGAVVCILPPPPSTSAAKPPIGPTSQAGQATDTTGLTPRYVAAIYPPSPGWHVV